MAVEGTYRSQVGLLVRAVPNLATESSSHTHMKPSDMWVLIWPTERPAG